jgi:hypothetical protein
MGYISYRADTTTCYLLANKDGNLDIVVSCGPRAGVYLGDGKGHYTLVKEGNLRKFLTQSTGHVHSVSLADYNNDGRMDLVVGLARWPVQQIYQNMGGGGLRAGREDR